MIMYSKVSKGTSKPTETTTGNWNENNISLILNIYTWHGAAEIKCHEGTWTVVAQLLDKH